MSVITHTSNIIRHRSPSQYILENPFGLFSPKMIKFHPVLRSEELAHAAQCPRKAEFFHRRGERVNWNSDYHRDPSNSKSKTHFQDLNWWSHQDLFKKTVVEILSNLGTSLNGLRELPITDSRWTSTIKDVAINFSQGGNCNNYLFKDLVSFFTIWNQNDFLIDFFESPAKFAYNVFYFNSSVKFNLNNKIKNLRGEIVKSFPILGNIDIIDFCNKKLIKIACHNDSWLLKKPSKKINTISADTPIRREEIVLSPFYNDLMISKQALATLINDYYEGIKIGKETYGVVPKNKELTKMGWMKYFLSFTLELATVDKIIPIMKDREFNVIEGLISAHRSFKGQRFKLLVGDPNPCQDPNGTFIRDDHCSLLFECRRKSIASLLSNSRYEIRRLEERIFQERISLDLSLYRLAYYLGSSGNDPLRLNHPFLSFWAGEVISNHPKLIIELNPLIETYGLRVSGKYQIPTWSLFFGPIETHVVESIDDSSTPNKIIFQNSSNIAENKKITIYNPIEDDYLLRREQKAIVYHLLGKFDEDPSKKIGQQRILEKVLDNGGRRIGQAAFGGWARFL